MSAGATILGPAVAGTWYPASAAELRAEVSRLMDAARSEAPPPAPVAALVAPHAGYVYSGAVAAAGFAALRGASFERVLLLGPSHYEGFAGAAVPASRAYRTPLGDVPIDVEAIERLRERPGVLHSDRPFRPEHSPEAEIPFLQVALGPGWSVVPVLLGGGSTATSLDRAAAALADLLGPRTLVVVSSDFTHFGARFGFAPFRDDVPRRIRDLDVGAVERIVAGDCAGFEGYVRETGATICGRDAIGVLLRLRAAGGPPGTLLAYDTSGRMTGDWTHTVSYASLAFGPGPAAAA